MRHTLCQRQIFTWSLREPYLIAHWLMMCSWVQGHPYSCSSWKDAAEFHRSKLPNKDMDFAKDQDQWKDTRHWSLAVRNLAKITQPHIAITVSISILKANGVCDGDEDSNTKEADDAASGRREEEGEEGGGANGGCHVIVSQMMLWQWRIEIERQRTNLPIPAHSNKVGCKSIWSLWSFECKEMHMHSKYSMFPHWKHVSN